MPRYVECSVCALTRCAHGGLPWALSQNEPKLAKRRVGSSPLTACPGLKEPRRPGFCDKGLRCPSAHGGQKHTCRPSHDRRLSVGCNGGLEQPKLRSQEGSWPTSAPGRGSNLTDYSVVEEVYLRMWREHGNQWRLKTDSPSQVLGRAQAQAGVWGGWR